MAKSFLFDMNTLQGRIKRHLYFKLIRMGTQMLMMDLMKANKKDMRQKHRDYTALEMKMLKGVMSC